MTSFQTYKLFYLCFLQASYWSLLGWGINPFPLRDSSFTSKIVWHYRQSKMTKRTVLAGLEGKGLTFPLPDRSKPDNFTHQGRASGWERVNICLWLGNLIYRVHKQFSNKLKIMLCHVVNYTSSFVFKIGLARYNATPGSLVKQDLVPGDGQVME